MKNHVFIILAHKDPCLLARTINILSKSNHYFFIHLDGKARDCDLYKSWFTALTNIFFIEKRFDVYHGGISMIHATLALFDAVINSGVYFDYIHLISGQDYPLRSNDQFDEFFEHTNHSFMYIDEGELLEYMQPFYERYANEYHFNKTSGLIPILYDRLKLGKIISCVIPRKPIENYHGGWQWFSWNIQTLNYVLDYIQIHPGYLRRFNHTTSPDEHVFATILISKIEELGIESVNPLRYISWHPHRKVDTTYRPFTFTELDYDYIIKSKAFFCRKVDEVESAKLLDMIDMQRGDKYYINEHTDYV